MDFREIRYDGVNMILQATDRIQRQTSLDGVLDLWFSGNKIWGYLDLQKCCNCQRKWLRGEEGIQRFTDVDKMYLLLLGLIRDNTGHSLHGNFLTSNIYYTLVSSHFIFFLVPNIYLNNVRY
jgi:hypothetical protein